MVFFDFAAAFPSVAREWIFFFLEAMNLDRRMINLLTAFDSGCRCQIMVSRSRYGFIDIDSGIKQRCPLSGTIFALLMDPILRMMHATIPSLQGRLAIGAYADDIAFAMSHFPCDLPKMLEIFALAGRASALQLKPSKCMLVPLNVFVPLEVHRLKLSSCAPSLAEASVAFSARHLGAMIGPCAHETRWSRPAGFFVRRARWIRDQFSVCTTRAIKAYRSYVVGHTLFHA